MSNLDNSKPIVVDATPAAPQLAAGIRQAALAVGMILSTLGLTAWAGKFDLIVSLATPIATLIVIVGPIIAGVAAWWGQMSTRHIAQKAATLAALQPDEVATFKK